MCYQYMATKAVIKVDIKFIVRDLNLEPQR